MSEDHVHGPDCTKFEVIPLTSEPVLVVIITKNDLETGSAYIEGRMPAHLIPSFLRGLAEKVERQNKAGLS